MLLLHTEEHSIELLARYWKSRGSGSREKGMDWVLTQQNSAMFSAQSDELRLQSK
jgi:hypothetical protein